MLNIVVEISLAKYLEISKDLDLCPNGGNSTKGTKLYTSKQNKQTKKLTKNKYN